MKLSDYLEAGIEKTEPVQGLLLQELEDDSTGDTTHRACAMGAAIVGKIGWTKAYKRYNTQGRTCSTDFDLAFEIFPDVPEWVFDRITDWNDGNRYDAPYSRKEIVAKLREMGY